MLPERVARARDLCAEWVKSGHTPAIVALVARRGVVVLHEAFGALRPGPDASALRRDSLFPMSSITKPMAASVLMTLVEDGLIGLNRPLVDYLPEISGEGTGEILLHHVLTHTAGYDDFAFVNAHADELQEFIERGDVGALRRETLRRLYSTPVQTAPGAVMNYSPLTYMLLGEIAQRVTGRSFPELVQERLFDPLGMGDSVLAVPDALRGRVVKRPAGAPWTWQRAFLTGIDSRMCEDDVNSSGGVFSTARDAAAFGQMFLNGGGYGSARVLSHAGVEAMTRNQTPGVPAHMGETAGKQASYGYGWFIQSHEKWRYWDGSLPSLGSFHHQGAGGVLLWVDPAREIVGVYLSVDLAATPELEPLWNADLFQNVVTAAVAD